MRKVYDKVIKVYLWKICINLKGRVKRNRLYRVTYHKSEKKVVVLMNYYRKKQLIELKHLSK